MKLSDPYESVDYYCDKSKRTMTIVQWKMCRSGGNEAEKCLNHSGGQSFALSQTQTDL